MSGKKIFFNHAAVGPVNRAAFMAAANFLYDYAHVGPPKVLETYDAYSAKLAEETAIFLNCSSEEISYIKNTTEGITIASEALPFEKGDQILLLENEYPANLLPWLKKRKDRHKKKDRNDPFRTK